MLDGTVVNVALRTHRRGSRRRAWPSCSGSPTATCCPWPSLILLGGSLGDRFGRRRIFVVGVIWFAGASLLCGARPEPRGADRRAHPAGRRRRAAHARQPGHDPGRLPPRDRARAIGAWSGLGGIAAAIGPFVGGWLVQYASWRLDLPDQPAAGRWSPSSSLQRLVPETRDPNPPTHFDVVGAALAALALGGVTYALIEWGSVRRAAVWRARRRARRRWRFVVGRAPRAASRCCRSSLFRSRQFSAANAMTLLVYAALGAMFFFLVLAAADRRRATAPSPPASRCCRSPSCMLLLAARAVRSAPGSGRAPDDGRPDRDARSAYCLLLGSGAGRQLLARRAAGRDHLRARPGADGRAADRDRARGRARQHAGHRERREQRRRPGGVAARGRRAAGRGRPDAARTTPTRRPSTRRTARRC